MNTLRKLFIIIILTTLLLPIDTQIMDISIFLALTLKIYPDPANRKTVSESQ